MYLLESILKLSLLTQLLLGYFLLINIITFTYFGFDKLKATMNHERIREITLWILCLIGGSLGGLIAMNLFRHKTKKQSFQAILAIILALQIWILYLILK